MTGISKNRIMKADTNNFSFKYEKRKAHFFLLLLKLLLCSFYAPPMFSFYDHLHKAVGAQLFYVHGLISKFPSTNSTNDE